MSLKENPFIDGCSLFQHSSTRFASCSFFQKRESFRLGPRSGSGHYKCQADMKFIHASVNCSPICMQTQTQTQTQTQALAPPNALALAMAAIWVHFSGLPGLINAVTTTTTTISAPTPIPIRNSHSYSPVLAHESPSLCRETMPKQSKIHSNFNFIFIYRSI